MKLVSFKELKNGDVFKIHDGKELFRGIYKMLNKKYFAPGQIVDIKRPHWLMLISTSEEQATSQYKYLIVRRKNTEVDDTGMDFL